MENGWSLFTRPRGEWDMWAIGCTSSGNAQAEEETVNPAHMLLHSCYSSSSSFSGARGSGTCSSMGVGSDPVFLPDPDPLVVSLKLDLGGGKSGQQSLEEEEDAASASCIVKRGKSYVVGGGEPRCQVEGCKAGLENAKGYHRKHKVCEMHAKAPKVLLLGHQQRFCQQCSRFHAVSEFDESKRSCRRRLAGHNERRRKISQDSPATTKTQCHDYKLMMAARRYQNNKRAHSLLSTNNDLLVSPAADLPNRCTAALNDLIAENRAAILARQIMLQATHSHSAVNKHPSLTDFQFT